MADVTAQGFGASAATVLLGSANNVMVRTIISNPGRIVRIRNIIPVGMQVTGAKVADPKIGVMVVLGRNPQALPASGIPFRPGGGSPTGIAGFWIDADAQGFIKKYGELISLNGQGNNLNFGEWDLVAQDGEFLSVVVGSLIDATTFNVTDFGAIGLTVLGDDIVGSQGSSAAQFAIGGGQTGIGRSLPKWDIGQQPGE